MTKSRERTSQIGGNSGFATASFHIDNGYSLHVLHTALLVFTAGTDAELIMPFTSQSLWSVDHTAAVAVCRA
jgi:hypothetical protein